MLKFSNASQFRKEFSNISLHFNDKLYTSIFFIICLSFSGYSQGTVNYAPKLSVPTSPEAAMLGKFGDIPIGYNTGTVNISIPLYTISESGIDIPIALEYHGSGIKVTEEATWVGLGWNLAPEGSVIQEVRGKKDQLDDRIAFTTGSQAYWDFKDRFNTMPMGTYKVLKQIGINMFTWCGGDTPFHPSGYEDSEPTIISLLAQNGQPDVYHYNFSGHSGSFFINPDTGSPVMLDKSDGTIFTGTGAFRAITPEGNSYVFGEAEDANTTQVNGDQYSGATYKLTGIGFANGKNISFTYDTGHITSRTYAQNATMNFACTSAPMPDNAPIINYINSEIKILKTIVTEDITINFNTGARTDIYYFQGDYTAKLESVDISSNVTGKKIKSYLFNYAYFVSSPTTGTDGFDKRLKLESVKEVGYSYDANGNATADTSKPPYVFTYNISVLLPPKTSFAQDFWGYYNGKTGNIGLLPDLDFFDYNYDNEFRDWSPFPGRYPFQYNYVKNNRYTDNTKVGACMLQRIAYPTGGYTDFEFESNSFTNQFMPNIAQLNVVNVNSTLLKSFNTCASSGTCSYGPFSLVKSTTLTLDIKFNHGNPQASGSINSAIVSDIYNNSYVLLRKNGVEIKRWIPSDFIPAGGNGLQYFINKSDFTIGDIIDYRLDYQAGATYTIEVYFPEDIPAGTYSSQYVAITTCVVKFTNYLNLDMSTSYQAGLRIKSIKNYTAPGVIASHKELRYVQEDGLTSSGILLNKFHPLSATDAFCNSCNGAGNGVTGNLSIPFRPVFISADDFGTGGGTIVGYERVEEVELAQDNNTTMGKTVFNYFDYMNYTKKGFPNLIDPRNGRLKSEEYIAKDGTKLSDKLYSYEDQIVPTSYDGITIVNHSYGGVDFGDGLVDEDGESYKYSYETNPLDSHWYKSKTVTTNNYYGTDVVTQVETYDYNAPNRNRRSVTTTNSANEEVKTTYYYAPDHYNNESFNYDMEELNMIEIPIVTEQYRGTALLSRQTTKYTDFNTLMLPFLIYAQKGGSTSFTDEKKVTFDLYQSGNLVQYTMENGIPVTILWGYNNTLPVAKIEGLQYSNIPVALKNAVVTASNLSAATAEAQLLTALTNIRNDAAFAGSMVTTYTYKPGVGVSTITDSRGYKISYIYDNFGRLFQVKDAQNNILSEDTYHFRP